jgi:cyclic pyranopterin phosphate synthase
MNRESTQMGTDSPVITTATPDQLGRKVHDLRLSVTDRCNFRCTYCMPKEIFGHAHPFLPKSEILTFEEMVRISRIFVGLGVGKIRVTGGEPLLRRDLPKLIEMLMAIEGLQDLALTTNGSALASLARPLRQAGLKRITVSLDALDDTVFRAMNDVDFPVERVLAGMEAALDAGFAVIKVNMVVKRGVNEHEILPMARRFSGPQYILRFIEFMDVGNTNRWLMNEVVTASQIIDILHQEFPLESLPATYSGEVARRFRHADGGGEIGIISSVTQPFCSQCSRARVSAEGRLYTCLFASQGHDLRALLRQEPDDAKIAGVISQIWAARNDRYSELRSETTQHAPKVEMSRMGG